MRRGRSTSFVTAVARGVVAGLEFVCFWIAVVLPLGYLSLLYDGLTGRELVVLGGLFVLHLLVLVVGQGYKERTAYDRFTSSHPDRNRSM